MQYQEYKKGQLADGVVLQQQISHAPAGAAGHGVIALSDNAMQGRAVVDLG
jgi:hypothetical protein